VAGPNQGGYAGYRTSGSVYAALLWRGGRVSSARGGCPYSLGDIVTVLRCANGLLDVPGDSLSWAMPEAGDRALGVGSIPATGSELDRGDFPSKAVH